MEFVGYTSKEMLDTAETIYFCKGNYVINDGEHFKLAIKMPQCNKVDTYALYMWDEFANGSDEERDLVILSKKEETIRFFQETTGVINNVVPTLLYYEVQTILNTNNGTVEHYTDNTNTDVFKYENLIDISIEHDLRRNVWLVIVRGVVQFTLDNETSAKRIYTLIKKDITNYVFFRWGRPQQ